MTHSYSAATRGAPRLALAAVAPCLVLALVGCSDGRAASSTEGTGRGTSSATASAYDWDLAFAKCMREAGIDYADPTPGGGEAPMTTQADSAGFEQADRACSDELGERLGERPVSEDQKRQHEKWDEQNEKLADCLRKEGYQAEAKDGVFRTTDEIPDAVFDQCGGDDYQDAGGGTE